MTTVKRHVREDEIVLLRFLAQYEPEYRDEYLKQSDAISEVEDWNDGTQSITIVPGTGYGTRVHARAEDEDGIEVDVTLFGKGKSLFVLEILRADGQPIRR